MLSLTMTEPDIAVLTFDDPDRSVNILSKRVLDALERQLEVLEQSPDLAGLILRSGKPGSFIAGADLREFLELLDAAAGDIVELCHRGRRLFQRFSRAPFVTICAIDGICVGGGAEMASWCDYRLMTDDPKTSFGFPEVKLGIYPGWGGTVRAPRIAGLGNAVEMITGGESISPREALGMGWLWDVVPRARLMEAAVLLVRQEERARCFEARREQLRHGLAVNETEMAFLGATASAYIQGQTKGHYPAPLAALEVILAGATLDEEAACQLEAEGFSKLFGTPVNRALINVFFLQDRNKKTMAVVGHPAPRDVETVSVVGAGIMGQGISAACIKHHIRVRLADISPEALSRATAAILEEASYNKQLRAPDVERMARAAPLLQTTSSAEELAAADLVIEAVVENAQAKKELFTRLESKLRDDAVLASNTSTIPIHILAEGLRRPERFLGIHFFNPVRRMPLVEVIRAPATDDRAVAAAVAFVKKIGKSPIVVKDGPGFLVNRLLMPYMNEAIELLLDGVPMQKVEKVARHFGMPMGPCTLFDVVGLDTALYAGRVLRDAFPDRFPESPLIPTLVREGRLGQKSGRGFFAYGDRHKKKGVPDPRFDELLKPLLRSNAPVPDEQIEMRLFLPMLLEATRALEESIAGDARDVDLALIYGIGFPPFKGGLFYWADTLGAATILQNLLPLEPLGPRFQPTSTLLELSRTGERFYR